MKLRVATGAWRKARPDGIVEGSGRAVVRRGQSVVGGRVCAALRAAAAAVYGLWR